MGIRKTAHDNFLPEVAANGLIDRRALLGRGVLIAGAMGTGVSASPIGAAADPLPVDAWSLEIGSAIPPYDQPAKYEKNVVRSLTNPKNEPRTSQARTPHHLLNGTITPNGLHFVVSRTGFPEHRSGQAPASHPRVSEAAACLHIGGAGAIPDGVAD